jgi:hypothetical protein
MGLDLTLGGLVLIMGIRGWLKGFVLQAIRLGGLVACVYLADPVRDLAKPRVIGHLASIHPQLVDRLLWWCSAVVSYVVLVGLASLIVKLSRRKPLGEPEPYRNDQFGGFLLGLGKGVVLAALAAAAIEKYGLDRVRAIPWADEQARTSLALRWTEKYQPVPKVWATSPVQHFVGRIQRMGIKGPADQASEPAPVARADQLPKLALPPADRAGLESTDFSDPELVKAVETLKEQVEKLGVPDN